MTAAPTRIKTPQEQRIDLALLQAGNPPLEEFAGQRRPNRSWPDITFELRQIVKDQAVSEQTLRRWFAGWID